MEISLPRRVSPEELDFSDVNVLTKELEENKAGYYSKNLATFLKHRMRRLRFDFLPDRHNPNRKDYIRVFYSSRNLVKNTLELIWFTKSDFMNWKVKLINLEKMEKEIIASKYSDFKREVDGLPWWKRTALHLDPSPNNGISRKLKEMKHDLDVIQEELEKTVESHYALASQTSRDLEKLVTMFKASNFNNGRDIAGKLRYLLIRQQLSAMIMNFEGIVPWMKRVLIITKSIKNCREWLQKELKWNEVCSKGNHWNCHSFVQVEDGEKVPSI